MKVVREHAERMVCQPVVQLSRFDPVVGGALLMLESHYSDGIPRGVLANLQRTLSCQ